MSWMTTEEAVRVLENLGGRGRMNANEEAAYQNAVALLAERAKLETAQTRAERKQMTGSDECQSCGKTGGGKCSHCA
jgi:hypothetical protein